VLQRDVETAQKAYEAALARYLVKRRRRRALANVTVLNPAAEPMATRAEERCSTHPGVVVGIVLAWGAVFLMELLDRRCARPTT